MGLYISHVRFLKEPIRYYLEEFFKKYPPKPMNRILHQMVLPYSKTFRKGSNFGQQKLKENFEFSMDKMNVLSNIQVGRKFFQLSLSISSLCLNSYFLEVLVNR